MNDEELKVEVPKFLKIGGKVRFVNYDSNLTLKELEMHGVDVARTYIVKNEWLIRNYSSRTRTSGKKIQQKIVLKELPHKKFDSLLFGVQTRHVGEDMAEIIVRRWTREKDCE